MFGFAFLSEEEKPALVVWLERLFANWPMCFEFVFNLCICWIIEFAFLEFWSWYFLKFWFCISPWGRETSISCLTGAAHRQLANVSWGHHSFLYLLFDRTPHCTAHHDINKQNFNNNKNRTLCLYFLNYRSRCEWMGFKLQGAHHIWLKTSRSFVSSFVPTACVGLVKYFLYHKFANRSFWL